MIVAYHSNNTEEYKARRVSVRRPDALRTKMSEATPTQLEEYKPSLMRLDETL